MGWMVLISIDVCFALLGYAGYMRCVVFFSGVFLAIACSVSLF